jgi:membrane-bound serine protease (ClpP class)
MLMEMSFVCAKGEVLKISADEALEWGFIDGIPETREELLKDFLRIDPANLYVIKPSWSESLVSFLDKINFLLLIVGLLLLYIEYHVPGFGIPGIAGLTCLGILFFGKYLVGLAEFTELLMIIGGLGLIAVEIFVIPGTFAAGIVGGLLVLGGLILSFQPFVVPDSPWQTELFLDNITYVGLSIIVALIASAVLSRFLPRTSLFKPLVLDTNNVPGSLHGTGTLIDDVNPELKLAPGDTGVAQSTLRPSGKVQFNDTLIDAQSEGGFIEQGEKVEIVRVTGNFVFVRKFKENQS